MITAGALTPAESQLHRRTRADRTAGYSDNRTTVPTSSPAVHFMANLSGKVSRSAWPMVAALVRSIFGQPDKDSTWAKLAEVVDKLTVTGLDAVAEYLLDAADDILAFSAFPVEHWPKLRSNNPQVIWSRPKGVFHVVDGEAAHQGHEGTGVACRRARDGLQAHRVRRATLALGECAAPRRARAGWRQVRKGGVGRERDERPGGRRVISEMG